MENLNEFRFVKNPAGLLTVNSVIERELKRAHIDVIRWELGDGELFREEVPCSDRGKLGDFTFRRCWACWNVAGKVPLAVAQELYADPVGISDLNPTNGCSNPPPETQVKWITKERCRVLAEGAEEPLFEEYTYKIYSQIIFSDDPKSVGAEAFITSYHIYTEIGLRLFADTLKRHGLV